MTIVSLGALKVRVKSFEAVAPVLSVTCTFNGKDPGACGVPESTPAFPSKVIPGGSWLEVFHLYGGVPPTALNACE